MNQNRRKCELCSKTTGRMAFIPFRQGMIVCLSCATDWEQTHNPTKPQKIIKLGSPPFPAKILENGRLLAKLEHLWQAVRRYAKRNGYKVVESYGVVGVAPF